MRALTERALFPVAIPQFATSWEMNKCVPTSSFCARGRAVVIIPAVMLVLDACDGGDIVAHV